MSQFPQPSVERMVDAIRELTAIGSDELSETLGPLLFDTEAVLRRIVTRAVERGIELQRAAFLLDPDQVETPLRPPPPDVVVHSDMPTRRTKRPRKPT